jgi:putative sterol carrier protein
MAEDVAAAVQRIFDEMPRRLNPAAAKGIDAVVQFNLTGSAAASYYIAIKDGKGVVHSGQHGKPILSMTISATDFVDLIRGKLNSQLAFLNGKLKITGDMGLAMRIPTLFDRHDGRGSTPRPS